jgi:ferredoxin--NADP+ reductase
MGFSVAIVGSGPGGFYAAAALLRDGGDLQIDLIERLPTPFGLIRAGVAPDHQSTKSVSRAFERTALSRDVRYFGNVEIGRDLTMAELRGLYDAVILAVGAPLDRALEIPGEDLPGVMGSAALVGWYNGHPDYRRVTPPLDCERVVVVGNGNVALDIARVLAKTKQEMADTDIVDYAEEAIAAAPIREIVILGRRGPEHAKFAIKELREMCALANALPIVDPRHLAEAAPAALAERERRRAERNLAILRGFADLDAAGKRGRIRFEFHARPVEVLGRDRLEALRCERTRIDAGRVVGCGAFFEIPCGLLVKAIGYRSPRIPGVPFDAARGRLRNREGRIDKGLYAVGWCKRGPVGVIGSNKQDGDAVAALIRDELADGGKPGRPGLESMLRQRGVRWVDYSAWQAIDKAERAAAPQAAPRRKFVTVEDMLKLLETGAADGPQDEPETNREEGVETVENR